MKKSIERASLFLMLGVYLLAIAWINLSETPGFYDADMYADVLYAVKAWEARSLFPESWVFGNQLNVVAAPVLAALFYGILGKPFLAMGCAATVMAVLMLLSMNWMIKPVLRDKNSRLVSILFFMSVMLFYNEAVDGLKGWQLFFTMCAYYAGYGITLFLAFGCYLRAACGFGKRLWPAVILTCILSFGTGMQSVRQTLVMVIPMIGVELPHLLYTGFFLRTVDKATLTVTAAVSASNLAGIYAESQMHIPQILDLGAITLTPLSELPSALLDALITVYSMFVNYDGVSFVILGILVLFYIGGISGCIRQMILRRDWTIAIPMLLLTASVCAVGAVDVLTTMNVAARYYFPMYPLVGLFMAYLCMYNREWIKKSVLVLLVLVFVLSCVRELIPVFREGETEEHGYVYEIRDNLLENGYTHLCSIWHLWGPANEVLVAAGGQIEGVYRGNEVSPFVTVGYLYDTNVKSVDPQRMAYLLDGEEEAASAIAAAREKGAELELLAYYEECDWYLFTSPVNLLAAFS